MAFNVIQPSFGAGELTPALYSRVDLDKYHSGAGLIRNYFVDYHGGMVSRPGSEICNRAAGFTATVVPHLLPFIVAQDTAYVLELGDHYMRFFYDGAPVVEASKVVTGVTTASPAVVTVVGHGYASGDEIVLAGIGGAVSANGSWIATVLSANTFSLATIDGTPCNTGLDPAYTSGGTAARIYSITTPYATADTQLVNYAQSADEMRLIHPSYPIQILKRLTPSTFSLTPEVIGPKIDAPSGVTGTYSGGGGTHANIGYVITSVDADGKEESLPSFPTIVNCVKLDGINNVNQLKWTAPSQAVSHYNIYKWGPVRLLSPLPSVYGYIGQTLTTSYTDSGDVTVDFSKTPPQYADPFSPGQILSAKVNAAGAFAAGTYIVALTITDASGVGAEGYAVVDPVSNVAVGAVITKTGSGYVAPSITAGTATFTPQLSPASGDYPGTGSFLQQRAIYGGSLNNPETLVLSQTDKYSNYDRSPVGLDTDAITASIASRQVNRIKSITPMSTGAVVLTEGNGFLVSGGSAQAAITPTSITALPQAASGCNDLPPLVINYDILYGQSKGAVIRDLAFSWQVQSYTGTDRSALASHLFLGRELIDWCWAEEPFRLIPIVRDDGQLNVMTYVPEQEVYGWSHWDTNGKYLSVTSIPEGNANAIYAVVARFTGGKWVNYIERFANRVLDSKTVADAWCVDCGLALPVTYPEAQIQLSAATGTVTATASAAVFSSADVGKTLWYKTGKATVAGYIDPTHISLIVLTDFPLVPNTTAAVPELLEQGLWSLDTPVTLITGLTHLEGLIVTGLADGIQIPPTTVVNGRLTLPYAASKVVVGLGYSCDGQTLALELGEPTQQAKNKFIPGVTLRVKDTGIGLQVGQDFEHDLYPMKEFYSSPQDFPSGLFTGDFRQAIDSGWNAGGRVCFRQDKPFPATILGVIPEVILGDTMR